jgi:hypothetical protein
MEEMKFKQEVNTATLGLDKLERWDADLERGIITFSNPDGFTVMGDVQVIGSYDTDGGTWLWGWDHPSVDPPLAHAARLARDFGKKYDLRQYTERLVQCSEDDAWQFTAVAQYLAKATGSYRGPTGSAYVYMIFDKVTVRMVK